MLHDVRPLAKARRLHPGNACKWPDGRLKASRPAFAGFRLVTAAAGNGSYALHSPQQRHCAIGSPAQECIPCCRTTVLQHCVMFDP